MKTFVNSLPKSGTNLVQKCLKLASVPYSGQSVAASSCFGRHGLIKKVFRQPRVGEVPVVVGLEIPVAVSPQWLQHYLHRAQGYVSGHAAYSAHYHSILQSEGYKIIQVVRHPCAVVASWANYIAEPGYYWKNIHRTLVKLSYEERAKFLLQGAWDGVFYYKGLREVLAQIDGWLTATGVLVVRYEDLVGSRGGGDDVLQRTTVHKILAHIEYDADESIIDLIADNLYGGTHTFRKGIVDSWKASMSDELLEMVATELEGSLMMQKLGYALVVE